jgi:hypothetical protein
MWLPKVPADGLYVDIGMVISCGQSVGWLAGAEGEKSMVSVLVDVQGVSGGAGLGAVRALESTALQVLRLCERSWRNSHPNVLPSSVEDPWHFGVDPNTYPHQWLMDPDTTPDLIRLLSSMTLKGCQKIIFSYFFLITHPQAHYLQS